MKKILFIIVAACISVFAANAQTRVVSGRTASRKILVAGRPAIRAVVTSPARAVVVRPVVQRRFVVVRP